jgi:DNA polymerase-3 subunit beta
MIFETTVDKLISGIENANRVTARNSTLTALNTILMLVSGKVLKIRATNLSLGVEFEVPVKAEQDGVIAVDGKIIADFLSALPRNAKITAKHNETTLTLSSGSSRTIIKTHPYEDFPTLPSVVGTEVTLPKNEFIRGVKSTAFAAAQSDIKPEISSVYLYADKNTLFFVATDSFRLAEKKETLRAPAEFPAVIIPYKNMVEIARVIESVEGVVTFTIGENQVSFQAESVYLTSRVVSGAFPDYKQIIPKAFGTEVVILKQDLLSTLKAANIFSDKFNQITFVISPENKKMECLAQNSDVGEYTSELTATLTGDEVSVSINQRYFIEALALIPQDSITMGLNGSNRAIVVRGVSDASFTYLLMPMNR